MTRLTKQSAFRRFFTSRLFLVVALVAVSLVAISLGRSYIQNYRINQKIRELQSQVQQLERKKLESMEILEYVTSNAFVEEKARTELNMKKPGENVVHIVNPESEPLKNEQKEDIELARQDISNPLKWWYYFTHKQPSGE